MEVAKTLLDRGADPAAVPVYNATRHLVIAALLLDHGGDVNAPSGTDQVPALLRVLDTWDTVADKTFRRLWVRFLLDHGANVHIRGGGLRSALDLARAWGDTDSRRCGGADQVAEHARRVHALVAMSDPAFEKVVEPAGHEGELQIAVDSHCDSDERASMWKKSVASAEQPDATIGRQAHQPLRPEDDDRELVA